MNAGEHTDDALLDALGAHLDDVEPLPADADTIIDAAFSFLTAEDELASLLDDTLAGADGMRGDSDAHTILFGFDGLQVEIHREPDGQATGQVLPPGPASLSLQHRSDTAVHTVGIETDDVGRFVLPPNLVLFRLRIERHGSRAFWTPWTVL